MRELKYRVYDNVEKCYSDKAFSIDRFGDCYVQDEDGYWEEIDEERYVVERCTGLKDKNEKYIYEGDIVCFANVYYPMWVVWHKTAFRLQNQAGIGCPIAELPIPEVIGNIQENIELLGKEKA